MSGNTNYVDYEVLETGVTVYSNQSEEIVSVMSTLSGMNQQLGEGWQNETARAFIEMYDTEYAPALQKAAEALASISSYIKNYVDARREEDINGAAGLGK